MTTTGLLDLPDELLLDISECLPNSKDLAALVKTCRRFHAVANGVLYKRDVSEGQGRALLWAASHGVMGTISLSLAAGADIDSKASVSTLFDHAEIDSPTSSLTDFDATALQIALLCRHDSSDVLLIERGADIKTKLHDYFSLPPLHVASGLGLPGTVEQLLKNGANVTTRDARGFTPLHHALSPRLHGRSSGNPEVVSLLLKHGTSIFSRSNSGRTPVELFRDGVYVEWQDAQRSRRLRQALSSDSVRAPEDTTADKKIRKLLEGKEAAVEVARLEKEGEKKSVEDNPTKRAEQDRVRKKREEPTQPYETTELEWNHELDKAAGKLASIGLEEKPKPRV